MWRLVLCPVICALVAAGCGDDAEPDAGRSPGTTEPMITAATTTTTPTTAPAIATTVPAPTGLPALLVGTEMQVVQLEFDQDGRPIITPVVTTEDQFTEVRMAEDGSVIAEEYASDGGEAVSTLAREVARYRPDGSREVIDGYADLFDLALVNGEESMITAPMAGPDGDVDGDDRPLVAVGLDSGQVTELHPSAFGIVHGTTNVDWVGGVGVMTGYSDLTEAVTFASLGPDVSGWSSPTDDLEYNAPPWVVAATFSPDGATLWWAEGPDHGYDPDTNESGPQPGRWVVRGIDLATGDVVLDWPISGTDVLPGEEDVVSIHDLGTHLIVNRFGWVGSDEVETWNGIDLPAVVIDLSGDEPAQSELPIPGIASPPG